MKPDTKNAAGAILAHCKTLAEADDLLRKVRPALSRASRWGMFDGWTGRASTLAGLAPQDGKEVPTEIAQDYNEGRAIGIELSLRNVPA